MKRILVVLTLMVLAGCASAPRGRMTETTRPLDLAIDGEGYFILATGQGGYLFTRRGEFFLDSNRYLVNADGYHIAPEMMIPNSGDIKITLDGKVLSIAPDTRVSSPAGQIRIATFADPKRLQRDGIYSLPTSASGDPATHTPGSGGAGTIRAGFVEK